MLELFAMCSIKAVFFCKRWPSKIKKDRYYCIPYDRLTEIVETVHTASFQNTGQENLKGIIFFIQE